jgi:hypothetical protein
MALRLLTVAIAGAALALGSEAACAAAAAVLLCSLAAGRMTRVRHRVTGLAGLALAAAVVAAAVAGCAWAVAEGVLRRGLGLPVWPEGRLTEHRVTLWRDAAELAERYPALVVGPTGPGT